MKKIILASKSPRRRQLLEWAEIPFEIMSADTDETYPDGLSMEEIAMHIAYEKAKAVAIRIDQPDAIILAADTIVVLGDRVIGKPADRSEAIETIAELSGQQHTVITGVTILASNTEIRFADKTNVQFHEISRDQIEYYVDKYQPYDKAGAYAVQEWIGVVGIAGIEGDFYNVMGLPVSRVIQHLHRLGL